MNRTLLQAMARMEGFYADGTRPKRNLNPGDIEYGRFAVAHGASGSDGRFAVFPTAEAGFAAMRSLLCGPAYNGLTIAEAIHKWAPSNENDTATYIKAVCSMTDLEPTTIVTPEVIG